MDIKKTPLNETHQKLGAKMVDFGGWHMPIQYQGIIEEHMAVRTKAGLFDVSHMGEIWIEGKDALACVQFLLSNDASHLKKGDIQYSILCNEQGGTVDDLLVYAMDDNQFLLVVNAGNKEKDFQWIMERKIGDVQIIDRSEETAQLALQGPMALQILQPLTDISLQAMPYYSWDYGKVIDVQCLISRTGYTGEDGFELYFEPSKAVQLWEAILSQEEDAVFPIGLGARDTLRFEAGMPLYGHELGEEISPLEAKLGKFVALNKPDFIGKTALAVQKETGLKRKLAGFEMIDKGIARAGYSIYDEADQEVGIVTTGSPAPYVNKNLGNALLKIDYAVVGKELWVDIRGKKKKIQTVATPFYKRG